MRITSLTAAVITAGTLSASATINWRSDTTTVGYLLRDIDTTPLTNGSSGTAGFFVQLLRDGGNGLADPTNSTIGGITGATGDDVVVDVAWIGSGGIGTGTAGVLRNQQNEAHLDGGRYFARIWNAPTAVTYTLTDGNEGTAIPLFDIATGANPVTSKPLRYGDSALFAATGNSTVINQMDFQAVASNVYHVPEPTTATLLAMGVAGVGMALKRRRQQS